MRLLYKHHKVQNCSDITISNSLFLSTMYVYFMFFATRLMSWKGVQVLLFCLAAKIGQLPAPPAAAIATFRLRRPTVIGRANFCTRCPIGLPIALHVAPC